MTGLTCRWALMLLVLSILPLSAVASQESSILGVWELMRVDNLHPRDVPPYGMRNFVLVFEADGTFQTWIPGYSQPETRPYKIDGDEFSGWFGFSNDQHSPRKISFPSADRMELEFPDGAVTSFRRRVDSTDPLEEIDSKCVLHTVRNEDYDPDFVASAKKKRDAWDSDAEMPGHLVGEWITLLGEQTEDRLLIELVLKGDKSAKLTRYYVDYQDLGQDVAEGSFSVDGDWLMTSVMSCGAALRFELSDQELRLTGDGINYFEFERSVEDE